MTDEPTILALVPAYNEAQRIQPVIEQASAFLPVLVVDDGSADETPQVARRVGAMVLEQPVNQGKGAALKVGFQYAIDHGFEAVVTLDADGQHDPAEIPKFIELFEKTRADLVIGARDFSLMPPVRRVANWLGRQSLSWAMGETILDNQSGYRLISSRLMREMAGIAVEGFEFEVEMIVVCLRLGYELRWVEIKTIYAGESSHINPLKHLVNYVSLVANTRREVRSR